MLDHVLQIICYRVKPVILVNVLIVNKPRPEAYLCVRLKLKRSKRSAVNGFHTSWFSGQEVMKATSWFSQRLQSMDHHPTYNGLWQKSAGSSSHLQEGPSLLNSTCPVKNTLGPAQKVQTDVMCVICTLSMVTKSSQDHQRLQSHGSSWQPSLVQLVSVQSKLTSGLHTSQFCVHLQHQPDKNKKQLNEKMASYILMQQELYRHFFLKHPGITTSKNIAIRLLLK